VEARKLEYFDLRELQQAITSKVAWDRLRPIFATEEVLEVKLNQLAAGAARVNPKWHPAVPLSR
jgi:hypothetical protein